MPGEPKPQLPQKHNDSRPHEDEYTHDEVSNDESSSWDMDVSLWDSDRSIKREHIDDDTDEESEENEDNFPMLPDITQKLLNEEEKRPQNKFTEPFKHVETKPLNNLEKISQSNNQRSLSPIPSVHFSEDLDYNPDEKKPLKSEYQLSQNSRDAIPTDTEISLLKTEDGEQDRKPSCLVDKKPPLSQFGTLLSGRTKPIHKPFLYPKKEKDGDDTVENVSESSAPTVDTSFLNVQIKQENSETNNATTNMNSMEVIEIKKEDINYGSDVNSFTNVSSTVSVKDEPVDQGKSFGLF